MNRVTIAAWALLAGFLIGYNCPRDLEIESTKPIVLSYEITPEAARVLVFKYAKDHGEKP
jgi:hypothetical protein